MRYSFHHPKTVKYSQYLLASIIEYIQWNTHTEFQHWVYYVAEILPLLYFRCFYGQLSQEWKWDLMNWSFSLEEYYFHRPVKVIEDHGLVVLNANNIIGMSKLQLLLCA